MKSSVGVCLLVNNSYYETRYCIENLLAKTNYKFRFYIIDNGSTDARITDYCRKLCNDTQGYFSAIEQKSYSVAYNLALRICTEDYLVIFPVNCLVNKNWLEDLIHDAERINNSGALSIRSGFEKVSFVPLLHKSETEPEDKLLNVHLNENNIVDGLMCFKSKILLETGYLDEHIVNSGFELIELSFRIGAHGFHNFYIRNQNLIKLHLANEVLFPLRSKNGIQELKVHINAMYKNRIFKK
jgi:hypothetical protein